MSSFEQVNSICLQDIYVQFSSVNEAQNNLEDFKGSTVIGINADLTIDVLLLENFRKVRRLCLKDDLVS